MKAIFTNRITTRQPRIRDGDLGESPGHARPDFETPDLSPLGGSLSPAQIQKLRDGILFTPLIDISATEIRQRVREELPISHLVPDRVAEYIDRHGLYR